MSLMRSAREGGVVMRSSAASRRALSRLVLSISRNFAVLLGIGSMSTHSVANSTWEAVLEGESHI